MHLSSCNWLPFYRPCSFASQTFVCFADFLIIAFKILPKTHFIILHCSTLHKKNLTALTLKNLKKEQISDNSKLNLLYLKKDVDPKLRLVALDAILLFFMNLFFTIVWIFISQIINNDSIKKICEISYIFLFLIIGTIPIIKFNLNKK